MEVFTLQYLTLNGNVVQQPEFNHAETADNAIADSRAFFQGTLIEAMTRSRNVETAIGILPIPKFEETQPSYTSMINPNGVALLLGIPMSAKDPERTSVITEALYSYGKLIDNLMKATVSGKGNFASIYEAAKTSAQIQIDEHVLMIENLE
ncbi:MAG: hypothetical protein PHZ09_12120 [Eubacteriales bacterium]|jgi:sRNA-binding protein|nr:hypothetical protein [Eubacteriales bacterium]